MHFMIQFDQQNENVLNGVGYFNHPLAFPKL